MTNEGSRSEQLPDSTQGIEVFVLNEVRWAALKESRRSGNKDICGHVLRCGGIQVTEWCDDDSWESTCRIVQSETRDSVALNNRSRVYSGLRRSEGRSLDVTIPSGTRNHDQAYVVYGQRRSVQLEQGIEICSEESPYRTPIPLPTPASPIWEMEHNNYSGEEQSSRHPDEIVTYECDEWMEGIMDEYIANMFQDETPILEITEHQLQRNGLSTWTLE